MKTTIGLLALGMALSGCVMATPTVTTEPGPEPAAVEEEELQAADPSPEPTSKETKAEPEDEYTFAEKLAIIDGQSAEDAEGYQLMLDAAAPLCPEENEESLANLTVKAKTLLADRGVEVEVLWGLGMVIMGVSEETAGMVDCAEVMALAMVAEVDSQ